VESLDREVIGWSAGEVGHGEEKYGAILTAVS
jgi:hypothetical protein